MLRGAFGRARVDSGRSGVAEQAKDLLEHLIELMKKGEIEFRFDTTAADGELRLARLFFSATESLQLFALYPELLQVDGTFGLTKYFHCLI